MTGRILIVDDVATNRIVMKVKLAAACYAVDQASCGSEALAAARDGQPDLILLDVLMPDMSGLEVCRLLKQDPATAEIPVILITALADHANKMAGLRAGADDFLTKPVDEMTLLARVRSLLRARDTVRELRQRGETCAGLGFAEAATPFDGPSRISEDEATGQIALVAPGPRGAVLWKTALDGQIRDEVRILPRKAALTEVGAQMNEAPDVYVISADLMHRNEGLRLLSDLRSRPATRHSATVMILPAGDSERAAIALDLGASDIVYDPFDPQELAIRIRAQMLRKQQADRLRDTVRTGLEMAVTDSLTGLHNRRFALFELDRLLARADQSVAVMMLDLDHFKSINDTHGHLAGDDVLRLVARRLRGQLRSGDLLARMGGEEFLVALPDADMGVALDCAERLRHAISDRPFELPGKLGRSGARINVTLSVGLALAPGSTQAGAEAIIEQADRALYGAKAHGRDQVTLADLPAA